jgi:NADH dehydrogenase FAD-containing subunit
MLRLTACVRRGAQSAQSILTMFDERLQRQALASFEQSGVEVRTGVRVVEVTQEQVRPGADSSLFHTVSWHMSSVRVVEVTQDQVRPGA